jgi:hypothetical protein
MYRDLQPLKDEVLPNFCIFLLTLRSAGIEQSFGRAKHSPMGKAKNDLETDSEGSNYTQKPLTDEQYEDITMWIKTKDPPETTDAEKGKKQEAVYRFKTICPSSLCEEVGVLTEDGRRDEE